MNHIKKIVVLTYLLVFLVGCSKIQSEEFNEEITNLALSTVQNLEGYQIGKIILMLQ